MVTKINNTIRPWETVASEVYKNFDDAEHYQEKYKYLKLKSDDEYSDDEERYFGRFTIADSNKKITHIYDNLSLAGKEFKFNSTLALKDKRIGTTDGAWRGVYGYPRTFVKYYMFIKATEETDKVGDYLDIEDPPVIPNHEFPILSEDKSEILFVC